MNAFIVILVSIAFALVLKIMDLLTNRNNNNAETESNYEKNIMKIDITNEADLRKALEFYKGMPD